eukprot:gene23324-21829_t
MFHEGGVLHGVSAGAGARYALVVFFEHPGAPAGAARAPRHRAGRAARRRASPDGASA